MFVLPDSYMTDDNLNDLVNRYITRRLIGLMERFATELALACDIPYAEIGKFCQSEVFGEKLVYLFRKFKVKEFACDTWRSLSEALQAEAPVPLNLAQQYLLFELLELDILFCDVYEASSVEEPPKREAMLKNLEEQYDTLSETERKFCPTPEEVIFSIENMMGYTDICFSDYKFYEADLVPEHIYKSKPMLKASLEYPVYLRGIKEWYDKPYSELRNKTEFIPRSTLRYLIRDLLEL